MSGKVRQRKNLLFSAIVAIAAICAISMILTAIPSDNVNDNGTRPAAAITGTETVTISDASTFISFADRVNNGESSLNAELTADINLNGIIWTPIGTANNTYSGTFDGCNNTIYGLDNTSTYVEYYGLFGTTSNATIKNLTISNANIVEHSETLACGAFVGHSIDDITLENCSITSCNICGYYTVGGLIGLADSSNNNSPNGDILINGCSVEESSGYTCITSYAAANTSRVGGMIGYAQTYSTLTIESSSIFADVSNGCTSNEIPSYTAGLACISGSDRYDPSVCSISITYISNYANVYGKLNTTSEPGNMAAYIANTTDNVYFSSINSSNNIYSGTINSDVTVYSGFVYPNFSLCGKIFDLFDSEYVYSEYTDIGTYDDIIDPFYHCALMSHSKNIDGSANDVGHIQDLIQHQYNGGTVDVGKSISGKCPIYIDRSLTLNLNGNTIDLGSSTLYVESENVTVTNGTVYTIGTAIKVNGYGSLTLINVTPSGPMPAVNLQILENGFAAVKNNDDCLIIHIDANNVSCLTIYSGRFYTDPSAYIAEDTTVTKNQDDTYSVTPDNPEAAIGEQKYTSLADAVLAAKSNDTVVLLRDISLNSTIMITKSIIIDGGNEHIITGSGEDMFTVTGNVVFTINGVIWSGIICEQMTVISASECSGSLIIDKCTLKESTVGSFINVSGPTSNMYIQIKDCVLSKNNFTDKALSFCDYSGNEYLGVSVYNCLFTENNFTDAGIYTNKLSATAANVNISKCSFKQNHTDVTDTTAASGTVVLNSPSFVSNCLFEYNTANNVSEMTATAISFGPTSSAISNSAFTIATNVSSKIANQTVVTGGTVILEADFWGYGISCKNYTATYSGGSFTENSFAYDFAVDAEDYGVTTAVSTLPVCRIDTTAFPSIHLAIESAESGDTITLDCNLTGHALYFPNTLSNITLDLSGYTYTVTLLGLNPNCPEGVGLFSNTEGLCIKNGTVAAGIEMSSLIQINKDSAIDDMIINSASYADYGIMYTSGTETISKTTLSGSNKASLYLLGYTDLITSVTDCTFNEDIIIGSTGAGTYTLTFLDGNTVSDEAVLKVEEGGMAFTVTKPVGTKIPLEPGYCWENDTTLAYSPTVIDIPASVSYEYNGSDYTITASTGYTVSGDVTKKNKGDYTYTATLESGYVWSDETTEPKTVSWHITALKLTIQNTGGSTKVYNGNNIYNGFKLTNNHDGGNLIAIAEFNSCNVDEADTITFTISGSAASNYTVPDPLTSASITQKPIDANDIVWQKDDIYTYDSKDQSYSIAAYYTDTALSCTVYMTVSYEGTSGAATGKTVFKNAGDYSLTPTPNDSNYSTDGTSISVTILPISAELCITAGSSSKTYDGTPLTYSGYTFTDDILQDNDSLTAVTSGSVTDFGTGDNTILSYTITDGDEVVTGCYSNISIVKGTLGITKRDVTVRSDDASKTYDGTPLTAKSFTITSGSFVYGQGIECAFTGTITDVGTADNTFTFTFTDGTKSSNYTVTAETGTLTVSNAEIFDITVTGYSGLYDGDEHDAASYSAETVNDQEITFKVSKNAGLNWIDVFSVKDVSDSGTYAYRLSAPNHNSAIGSFTVSIEKREVIFTSESASKEYDGTPLTANSITVSGDGFADGEGASFNASPSITFVGSIPNDFSVMLDEGTDTNNYVQTKDYGELRIIPVSKPITITAYSDSKSYDGTPLVNPYYTYTQNILILEDILTVEVSGSGTDAGEYTNSVTSYNVIHKGTDVTDCYTFADPVSGTLIVEKRDVSLRSGSASQIYTGEPLSNTEVEISEDGFISGEGIETSGFISVTDVGTYDNTFAYEFKSSTKSTNYNITSVEYGKLTITEASLFDIEVVGYVGTYDGTSHPAAAYSAESVNEQEITWKFSQDGGSTWTDIFAVKDSINKSCMYSIKAPNHKDVEGSFTVTVNTQTLIIAAVNSTVAYGTESPEFNADDGSGWIGDECYTTYGTDSDFISAFLQSNYTKTSEIGSYSITWHENAKISIESFLYNYKVILNSGQLIVERANIQDISVIGYQGIYDGQPHSVVNYAEAATVNDQPLTIRYSDDDGITWSDILYITEASAARTYIYNMSAPNHKDVQGTFEAKVSKKTVGLSWTAPDDLVYDKTEKTPSVTATDLCNDDQCTVTIAITVPYTNVNVGQFTFTADTLDNDNYALPSERTSPVYEITAKKIELQWTAPADLVYDRTEKTPSAEIINLCDGDVCEFETAVFGSDNVNVGNFVFKVTNVNNTNYCYDETAVSPTYRISERTIGLNWSAVSDLVYDGNQKSVTAEATGLCSGDTCTVSVTPLSGADIVNAGTFRYSAVSIDNYNYKLPEDPISEEFTITKANILVKPDSGLSKTYLEADPIFTYTWSGNAEGETPMFTGGLDRLPGANTGQYMINKGTLKLADNGCFLSGNYDLYVPYIVYFTITPKMITQSDFTVDTSAETYSGNAITKTVTSALIADIDYTVSYIDNTKVGTAVMNIDGNANYSGNVTYRFDILSRTIAVPESLTYIETGSVITFEIPTSQYYTETSGKEHSGTSAGTYEFKFTLDTNCIWSDKSYDGKYLVYINVQQKTHTNESGKVDVIVKSKNGIMNDVQLVTSASEDTSDVEKLLSMANGTPKYKYDIKFFLDGKEIEPDTAVYVSVLIPSELKGTNYSIYHVHGNSAKQLKYTETGDYADVTMEEFSDLVFVSNGNTDDVIPVELFAVILIAVVLAVVGGIIVYQKKGKKA